VAPICEEDQGNVEVPKCFGYKSNRSKLALTLMPLPNSYTLHVLPRNMCM
jgi:hypothetical protein